MQQTQTYVYALCLCALIIGRFTNLSGPSLTQYGFRRFSVWEMERRWFNDGHYVGLELGELCLFAGWSSTSPGLSLVAMGLMLTDSDLLAPKAHCNLDLVHFQIGI